MFVICKFRVLFPMQSNNRLGHGDRLHSLIGVVELQDIQQDGASHELRVKGWIDMVTLTTRGASDCVD